MLKIKSRPYFGQDRRSSQATPPLRRLLLRAAHQHRSHGGEDG